MYTGRDEWKVEYICYEQEHVDKVLEIIKTTFPQYFSDFLTTEAGEGITEQDAKKIADSLSVEFNSQKKAIDKAKSYKNILNQGLSDFEKDRKKYTDIFNEEAFEEYQDDPGTFKSKTLRDECPIIKSTYYNRRAKVLDKYRFEFNVSDANELLTVVENLYDFAEDYITNIYDPDSYDSIKEYETLALCELDSEEINTDYTVPGVIGGGIRSHMLYKIYPSVFPNRSAMAIWALWYLTDKKEFDCKMGSEFLMIDTKAITTQQNYFYPYRLFTFYAHQIFQLLKAEAEKLSVYIDPEFRYVMVDSFLDFVANSHKSDIDFIKKQIKESGYGYL